MMDGYTNYDDLDKNKRYCLVDTMNVADIYYDVPDIADGVRSGVEARTLLLTPEVIAESAGICKKLSGKDWDDLKTIETDIMGCIMDLGMPVVFADISEHIQAKRIFALINPKYVISWESKLSFVDQLLFYTAMQMDNVDVMTEDRALCDAITSFCGTERLCTARKKHQERCARTAWFIGVLCGRYLRWRHENYKIGYFANDTLVVSIVCAKDRWGAVDECHIGDKPGAAAAIETYFRTIMPDDRCPCGSKDTSQFICSCYVNNEYGDELDNGLEKDESWSYLCSLNRNECWNLQKSVWSFE